ncbi:hypothetical protein ABT234_25150 [Streptomyces sp. NPDC001586]|uniref:LppU/SCO3897 family protein n=1 Tax=Streptomyces sp. NPDC001586 TaxID=3154387 RepID=UPI003325123C
MAAAQSAHPLFEERHGAAAGRLATPNWEKLPVPNAALCLDVDAVLTIPGAWIAKPPRVQVRIWRGPAAGTRRTVVLYGALAESHGIIVNFAETVARSIAAQYPGVGEARNAWWFGFWPRGLPRKELSIDYVSFAFAHVLGGEPDLDYPPGTYTVAVVTALAAGQRPAVIDFDPRQLRTQLHHLTSLHSYRTALLAGAGDRPGLPALPLLAADGHADAARTAEALGIAVRVLVPDALGAVEDYQRLSTSQDAGSTLVERQFHQLGQAEGALLARYAEMPDDQLSAGAVYRALTTVRTLAAALSDQAETGGEHADPVLLEALSAAQPELVSVRRLLDPSLIDDPGSSPHAVSTLGDAENAYLATISWWGPAVGDARRKAALFGHVWEKDREGLRTGYDPYGWMVLHNPTTGALALERPQVLPSAPYPDNAEILATPGNMTAFVLLPDGRCDILPTDPRYSFDDITWGYGGTGPDVFAQALAFADAHLVLRDRETRHYEVVAEHGTVLGHVEPAYKAGRRSGWNGWAAGSTPSSTRPAHATRDQAGAEALRQWIALATAKPRSSQKGGRPATARRTGTAGTRRIAVGPLDVGPVRRAPRCVPPASGNTGRCAPPPGHRQRQPLGDIACARQHAPHTRTTPGDRSMTQPPQLSAPPARSRKAGIAKIVVIAAVVIALGTGAVYWFVSRDDIDRAEAGDCLTNDGSLIFPDLRVVECDGDDAAFKVVRVLPDTKDTSRCLGLTDIGFNEELDRNRHRSGKQYVLCLNGIKR